MADFGGLLPAGWAVTLGILALILHRVWRWSGTALPPAAVVDKKYIGESIPESTPPESKLDGAEYAGRVRIASDVMYQRAPYIETVRVRAFAIESLVVIICGLVFIDPSTTILHWSNEQIAAFPCESLLWVNYGSQRRPRECRLLGVKRKSISGY